MGLPIPAIEFLTIQGLAGLWDWTLILVIIGCLLSAKI